MSKQLEIQETEGPAGFGGRFQNAWQLETPAFSAEAFSYTLHQLVLYPERTSSVILGAQIEATDATLHQAICPADYKVVECIRRTILPSRPTLDASMRQDCLFATHESDETLLVLFKPLDVQEIPYYHPQVACLAFHYSAKTCSIAYEPLTGVTDQGRLKRTLRMLLQIISKHAAGHMAGYQKRVQHDLLVPKDPFQATYLRLKQAHAAHYYNGWLEQTDPRKHVFEDLSIAAFLLEYWRQRQLADFDFVDVGCGNGLLVDLLLREGQSGYGFDLRARKSWTSALYEAKTQVALQERCLVPSFLFPAAEHGLNADRLHLGVFAANSFLIGNHADELTPWIPILAALASVPEDGELPSNPKTSGSDVGSVDLPGFLLIPCCMHVFSGSKNTGSFTKGVVQKGGRYAAYLAFLVEVCETLGFQVQQEALRIPSTKNKALLAHRRRLVEDIGVAISDRAVGRRGRLEVICRGLVDRFGGTEGFLDHARKLMAPTSTNKRVH